MTLLSDIYDVTLKKDIRGAAKGGFVRPTVGEHFMTHKDFKSELKELEEVTPVFIGYTQDLCTNLANVTESSYYSATPNRVGANAFDGSLTIYSNHWQTGGSYVFPQWLKYNFGITNKKRIEKYTLQYINFNGTTAPKAWTFEGSNDNVNWTVLNTQTEQTNWGIEEKRVFIFTNTSQFQYYRWHFTQNNGAYCLIIAEAEMMEGIYE